MSPLEEGKKKRKKKKIHPLHPLTPTQNCTSLWAIRIFAMTTNKTGGKLTQRTPSTLTPSFLGLSISRKATGARHKGVIQTSSIGGNAEPLSVCVLFFHSVSSCKSTFIFVFVVACREGCHPLTRAFLSQLSKQQCAAGDSSSRSESTGLHALALNSGQDDALTHASDDFFHGNKMIFQHSFSCTVFHKSRNPLRMVLRRKWSAVLTSTILAELAGANEVHSIW